jgi:hypothetical protein
MTAKARHRALACGSLHGGQGGSLVPPHTLTRLSLSFSLSLSLFARHSRRFTTQNSLFHSTGDPSHCGSRAGGIAEMRNRFNSVRIQSEPNGVLPIRSPPRSVYNRSAQINFPHTRRTIAGDGSWLTRWTYRRRNRFGESPMHMRW